MFGLISAARRRELRRVMQCDPSLQRFFHAMLARGVYLAPSAYERLRIVGA